MRPAPDDVTKVFVVAVTGRKQAPAKKEEGLAEGLRGAGQGGHRFEQFWVGDGRDWRRGHEVR